jgi:hypothetical protein
MLNGVSSAPAKDLTTGQTNARGIPVAPFIDRVEDYVTARNQAEGVLKNFQEMISCVPEVLQA